MWSKRGLSQHGAAWCQNQTVQTPLWVLHFPFLFPSQDRRKLKLITLLSCSEHVMAGDQLTLLQDKSGCVHLQLPQIRRCFQISAPFDLVLHVSSA